MKMVLFLTQKKVEGKNEKLYNYHNTFEANINSTERSIKLFKLKIIMLQLYKFSKTKKHYFKYSGL